MKKLTFNKILNYAEANYTCEGSDYLEEPYQVFYIYTNKCGQTLHIFENGKVYVLR